MRAELVKTAQQRKSPGELRHEIRIAEEYLRQITLELQRQTRGLQASDVAEEKTLRTVVDTWIQEWHSKGPLRWRKGYRPGKIFDDAEQTGGSRPKKRYLPRPKDVPYPNLKGGSHETNWPHPKAK